MRVLKAIVFMVLNLQAMILGSQEDSTDGITLRVLSYNVRYDSMPDNISVQDTLKSFPKALPQTPTEYNPNLGELPWSTRRIYIANDILSGGAQVYGGQELLRRQVDDLQELLGRDWAWAGIGRDDGKQSGEYSPIFYRRDLLRLHDWDTFWLSETPFEHSKYPDAGSKRICIRAHFSVIKEKSESTPVDAKRSGFTVLNTHLDDQSVAQRRLGASLILRRAKFEAIKTKRPVLLTGDFNSPSDDLAYQVITGELKPVKLNQTFLDRYTWTDEEEEGFKNFVLKDLLSESPPHRRSGHYATFTDFATINDTAAYERLDYVFAGATDGWTCNSYRVGSNLHDDGVYARNKADGISDHRPVFADICIDFNHDSRGTKERSSDLVRDNTQVTLNQ